MRIYYIDDKNEIKYCIKQREYIGDIRCRKGKKY